MSKRIPPDPKQCQAEVPGNGPFTDHRPNIQVIGVGQKRDYNKIYNSLVLTEIVPTGTHYLLTLEAPTGKFEAEVTKEVWDTHVLPVYQTTPMHCDVAVANMDGVTKMEKFTSQFEEWWHKNAAECSSSNTKDSLQLAFEAGRKSVLGDLDPKQCQVEVPGNGPFTMGNGISKCEECPCFHIELSEKGDPPETKCGLMQEEIFCHWGEEIDKRCPLHTQPVLLRKAGT